ncbi:MAG: hypothetical protein AAFN41_01785 [Planctomycetota bacterium]
MRPTLGRLGLLATLLSAAPALAQITGPSTAAVPDLPPAPFHEAWLFENPLPISLALAGLGIALLMLLLRKGKAKQGGIAFGVCVLLAGGAFAAGTLIETPRETLRASTARLVEVTAAGDAEGMRELLHPDVTLGRGQIEFIPEIMGREPLIARAESLPRDVIRVVVLEARAGLDGPRVGRTQVRLRAFGPGDQLYGHSWWGLDWQENDGEWAAIGIEPLWIQGAG